MAELILPEAPEAAPENEQTGEATQTQGSEEQPKVPTVEEALKEAEKWKHFSRKNEEDLKALKPLAEKWQEYEKSQKSAEQITEEKYQKLEQELKDFRRKELLTKIISEKNIPAEAQILLHGETEEELSAQAEVLVSLFGANKQDVKEEKKTPEPNPLQGFGNGAPAPKESFFDFLA